MQRGEDAARGGCSRREREEERKRGRSDLQVGEAPADAWRKWSQRFKRYLEAADLTEATEVRKIAILLHVIGEDGLEQYEAFPSAAPGEADTLERILGLFSTHYDPQRNTT